MLVYMSDVIYLFSRQMFHILSSFQFYRYTRSHTVNCTCCKNENANALHKVAGTFLCRRTLDFVRDEFVNNFCSTKFLALNILVKRNIIIYKGFMILKHFLLKVKFKRLIYVREKAITVMAVLRA